MLGVVLSNSSFNNIKPRKRKSRTKPGGTQYVLKTRLKPLQAIERHFLCKEKKPTNCLSVFDHFVGLALKGLSYALEGLRTSTCFSQQYVSRMLSSTLRTVL